MRQRAIAITCHLVFCLSAITVGADAAWGQVAQAPTQPDDECTRGASTWSCFGSMEVFLSMTFGSPDALLPMYRRKAVMFANGEVLVESETFWGAVGGERTLGIFFLARPSAVALASGWESGGSPSDVIDELQQIAEVLQAGFPNGPATLGDDWQTVTANVKTFFYPIGDRMEPRTISAMKSPDGHVLFSYRGVGEPMGPYQVSGTWSPTKPKPWRDDHPISYIGAKQRFETVGQARRYSPAH